MFKKLALTLSPVALLATPFVALAQQPSLNRGITGLLLTLNNALNMLMGIAITAAIVVFFYGLIKYLMSGESAEGHASGLRIMFMGVLTIFVMVSIWGLVVLLQYTFGVNGRVNVTFPTGAPVNGTQTF